MTLESLIERARREGASDLHLEAGMPVALRVQGTLRMIGSPVDSQALLKMARSVLNAEQWALFLQRRSYDLSKSLQGVRCRLNILQTSRGVGMAIRLLSSFEATLATLNLHPDLHELLTHRHGLILVSGPTGSGKSTTIAALIQEINRRESLHIVTLENPIEYALRPKRSLIRQREVGRDTPSFEQALLDAMREDPDVIVVGEMRHPETMRLTINAAETGHLVISTLHSSTAAEALQRVMSAFPAEIQGNVCAQLADCLIAVVCQRLVYRTDVQMRVPECEILVASQGVRAMIRQGNFSRLATALETGGEDRMWTFDRYRRWLDRRTDWFIPDLQANHYASDDLEPDHSSEPVSLPPLEAIRPATPAPPKPTRPDRIATSTTSSSDVNDGVLVLNPDDDDLEDIISALKKF